MGYIHTVTIANDGQYLIEPNLFATAGGTTTALTAGINNFTLFSGAYVSIRVGVVDANATLNVNNTGAKNIYYNDVQIGANMLTEGNIYTFIYDGTKWNVVGDITGQNIMFGTVAEWGTRYNFVAPQGTIMIYTNHGTIETNDTTIAVPAIKIADGSTPCIDLPFVGDDVKQEIMTTINNHINDNVRHITAEERTFWNNKLNCEDTVTSNNLILNRN